MDINSETVTAATAVAVAVATGAVFIIQAIVRDENAKQLRQINGTYIRSMGSSLTGMEIERKFRDLEQCHRPSSFRPAEGHGD